MDRNSTYVTRLPRAQVALRKESVDRNAEDWLNAGSLSRSLSARRAWIEICPTCQWRRSVKSLSARRAWIEITRYISSHKSRKSLSARRAWIEIKNHSQFIRIDKVALRKESVDRNVSADVAMVPPKVALRKESVDRNVSADVAMVPPKVALRKESVDRNYPHCPERQ